ncbi:MAG: hypothetical protein JXB14_01105 [Candidatus Altiarchaeota archaeon]|nr:hypothetical protein [Candidatus Altiarchaeota archaeon]
MDNPTLTLQKNKIDLEAQVLIHERTLYATAMFAVPLAILSMSWVNETNLGGILISAIITFYYIWDLRDKKDEELRKKIDEINTLIPSQLPQSQA